MTSKNLLYYGDNLPLLQDHDQFPNEFVDLIYIDPPFNSGENYNILYNDPMFPQKKSSAQIKVFDDMWDWGENAEKNETLYRELIESKNQRIANLIQGFRQILGTNSMFTYILYMTARIMELYRVLKPTGSFYLHCDTSAIGYLLVICDQIFGHVNFHNEIIWNYGGASRTQTTFPCKHDGILFYTKSSHYTFNAIYDDISKSYVNTRSHQDSDGRKWVDQNLGKVSSETFERMKSEGRVFQTGTGNWRRKQYLDEMKGTQITDVWNIDIINSQAKERLGYPTQKPEALLERIIQASSNEGDLILDSFCGCGTTISVSLRLNRRWDWN